MWLQRREITAGMRNFQHSPRVKSLNSEAIFKQLGANCTSHQSKFWSCNAHFAASVDMNCNAPNSGARLWAITQLMGWCRTVQFLHTSFFRFTCHSSVTQHTTGDPEGKKKERERERDRDYLLWQNWFNKAKYGYEWFKAWSGGPYFLMSRVQAIFPL